MFGNGKRKSSASGMDIETVIGRNTSIKGTISGSGNIRIDGTVEGEILSDGDVVVGEQGVVTAAIKAANVFISGSVKGNINADGKLSITSTGRLVGDVSTLSLSIDEGASFKGNSNMEKRVEHKTSEPKENKK
jgi:cytoskeletal protein CcmA (bactofilin family)